MKNRYLTPSLAACLIGVAVPGHAQPGPAITIDNSLDRHVISDLIYGMAEYGATPQLIRAASLPVLRWGGDGTTRYNWQVDSSNAGFDFYFLGGNGQASPTPGASADAFVLTGRANGAQSLLTIPIIPYINSTSAYTCSFPVSVYGAQQATNPYVHPNGETCGNSIAADGHQIIDTNILANHIPNTPAIQSGWINHLTGHFGTAARNGVRFYQMDNEPFGWANTHRDVQPSQPTYDTIESLTEQYAAAVKAADPTAFVLGPSDFGWPAYVGNGDEIARHDNTWNAPWYLQKMAQYKATHGVNLIDYFDEHYYPNGPGDDAWTLRSTRSLWDPTYIDESYIGTYYGAVMLIPRMKAWVADNDPGIKVALSEYSWGKHTTIVGALAQADVLGIFGREGLDFATMWDVPQITDPAAFSFLLYRNYDGRRHGFGNLSVSATSADQSMVSVYAAERRDGVLTIVLVNKTAGPLTSPVTIDNPAPSATATMFGYGAADLTRIQSLPPVTFADGAADVTVPAMSMNILVVPLTP